MKYYTEDWKGIVGALLIGTLFALLYALISIL